MRIGLFFQAGNFIGPEYFHALKGAGFDVTPVHMGVMSHESRGRELDRTGGLWNPKPIDYAEDFSELGGDAIYATAHIMDRGLDTGPVIYAERYFIDPVWNYYQFRTNLYRHCALVLAISLNSLERGVPFIQQTGFAVTWPQMPPH